MAQAPSVPWKLRCDFCSWYVVVNARGQRGKDPGSGVEAARAMRAHVKNVHGKAA